MLAALAVTAVLALTPDRASAALPIAVNDTADRPDRSIGDGVCATAGGRCTLRAAIQETNALIGQDTINLPAGTYELEIPALNEDTDGRAHRPVRRPAHVPGQGRRRGRQTCSPSRRPTPGPCSRPTRRRRRRPSTRSRSCCRPRSTRVLEPGPGRPQLPRARADEAENVDATPAVHNWTITQGCAGSTVTLAAAADSWVLQSSATQNYGTDSGLKVDTKSGANSRAKTGRTLQASRLAST